MSKVTASIDKYDMDAETITPNDDQIIFSVALPLKQQKIHERICLGLVSKKMLGSSYDVHQSTIQNSFRAFWNVGIFIEKMQETWNFLTIQWGPQM